MADKDTTPKLLTLGSDSETLAEASKMTAVDQPEMLNQADPIVSVSSTAQATLSASNAIGPSISESSSIQISPETVVDISAEGEKQSVEDGSKTPLVCPQDEDATPSRQLLPTCMCCCFTINYGRLEDEQRIPFYLHYVRKIRNSKYILLVLVALLVMSILPIYFGVAYKNSCPLSQISPVLMIIMRIVVVTLIFVRLMTIFIRRFFWSTEEPPRTMPISLIFILMVLLIIETINFYMPMPVFENTKDLAFCAKTFYDYVYYMNIAALVVGILASLLHIPQMSRSARQMLPQ